MDYLGRFETLQEPTRPANNYRNFVDDPYLLKHGLDRSSRNACGCLAATGEEPETTTELPETVNNISKRQTIKNVFAIVGMFAVAVFIWNKTLKNIMP